MRVVKMRSWNEDMASGRVFPTPRQRGVAAKPIRRTLISCGRLTKKLAGWAKP